MPGSLSPRLREAAARQGSKMPFAEASEEVTFFWGVWISDDTLRRQTEAAGAALTALEDEEVARLEREFPALPEGPAIQQVSVDGAMVPLVDGTWAEVKTAAIGTVTSRPNTDGEVEVHTVDLSYCSRLADVARFGRRFQLEVFYRGTQTAGTVVAVQDGADWIQGLLDTYRRDAVRVLDFAHLVEHLATAARAVYGAERPDFPAWLAGAAHILKHRGPDEILVKLRDLPVSAATDPTTAATLRDETIAYLAARLSQVQYPSFQAKGYPIGSGCVESAGKLLVEARLKGSGMRWARPNVCPMLALRAARLSGRWDQTWPALCHRLRQQEQQRRQARRLHRRLAHGLDVPATPPCPAAPPTARPKLSCAHARMRAATPPMIVNGKPTNRHPWKQSFKQTG
ncbi:MAG: hypothetical protein NVSMB65_20010 [Chloroflexota bacterium]